ncbi:hypothetical protein F7R01_21190 [Pseudomonas argentinensis]|uniref:Uncharacterized protein n=1 Tax=Phytopseudomonas argentinensis TaxID=289370 RepID=A0A1I3PVC7_9GAMM|nr:hypothetical protein [Pseudomonas argentinensis]KAB0546435.1 hypothetical protein F7R01_21190 [Pseudomonas argentinensis]SFJ24896.1 hypothetical protein SAMN05216602_4446 [Pseudomonas argentinensis]
MSTITTTGASAVPPIKAAPARLGNEAGAPARTAGEPEQQPSVTVTLSAYAQKRAQSMREAFGKLREMQARQQESRKEAARQKLEDIKKRIEMLKQLVVSLGPAGAKGALRQLKQLAQELGQAAAVLQEASGGGNLSVVAAQGATGEREAATAQAPATVEGPSEAAPVEADAPAVDTEAVEQAVGEDAEQSDEAGASEEPAGEQAQATRNERNERQRRADGEELKKVAAQLKQLLAMVRSQLAAKPDEDSKKLIDGISKQLAEVDKAAGQMAGGGMSLSIGAALSISV